MYEHHKQSIQRLTAYFRKDPSVTALILGGSVAKGCARPDSDLDATIVVTPQRFLQLQEEGRVSECIFGECTYEGGYFDIKYCTMDYLRAAAERGSEPTRNAFLGCVCLFSDEPEVEALLKQIPVFQRTEQAEKLLSFYSALTLSAGYFWSMSTEDLYLRTRSAADIVLFGLRLLLEEREVLFPCHKGLYAAVRRLPDCPAGLLDKADQLLARRDDEAKRAFMDAALGALHWQPPQDYHKMLTRCVEDNEQWWYLRRPVLAEW